MLFAHYWIKVYNITRQDDNLLVKTRHYFFDYTFISTNMEDHAENDLQYSHPNMASVYDFKAICGMHPRGYYNKTESL